MLQFCDRLHCSPLSVSCALFKWCRHFSLESFLFISRSMFTACINKILVVAVYGIRRINNTWNKLLCCFGFSVSRSLLSLTYEMVVQWVINLDCRMFSLVHASCVWQFCWLTGARFCRRLFCSLVNVGRCCSFVHSFVLLKILLCAMEFFRHPVCCSVQHKRYVHGDVDSGRWSCCFNASWNIIIVLVSSETD